MSPPAPRRVRSSACGALAAVVIASTCLTGGAEETVVPPDPTQRENFIIPLNGVEMVWHPDSSMADNGYFRSKEPFEPDVRDLEAYCRLVTFNCRNRSFDLPDYFGFTHEDGHLVAKAGLARPLVTRRDSVSEAEAPGAPPVPRDIVTTGSAIEAFPAPLSPRSAVDAAMPPGTKPAPVSAPPARNTGRESAESALLQSSLDTAPSNQSVTGRLGNGLVRDLSDFPPGYPPMKGKGADHITAPPASNYTVERARAAPSPPPAIFRERALRPLRRGGSEPDLTPDSVPGRPSDVRPLVHTVVVRPAGTENSAADSADSEPSPAKTPEKKGPVASVIKGGGNAVRTIRNAVGGAMDRIVVTEEEKQQKDVEKALRKAEATRTLRNDR